MEAALREARAAWDEVLAADRRAADLEIVAQLARKAALAVAHFSTVANAAAGAARRGL